MSQRKVQVSGKFEAVEEEECWDHQSAAAAAAAGGAGSRLAYNSSHTHPTTSNNYQQTETDTHTKQRTQEEKKQKKKKTTISTQSVTSDVIYFRRHSLSHYPREQRSKSNLEQRSAELFTKLREVA